MQQRSAWRVGIVGTRWGRTHVGTFRAAGCSVDVIVGRDAQRSAVVAAQEGIARHDEAALADCDIVVVATPVASHREIVERHADKVVFCEKPLFGGTPDDRERALVSRTRLTVNYAFAFLDTATRVHDLLRSGAIGPMRRAHLRVDVRLGDPQPALVWVREVAIHPLSWLQHTCGPLAYGAHEATHERVDASLSSADRPITLEVRCADEDGIAIRVGIEGERGAIDMSGGYRPGAGWSFAPVHVDGVAHGDGEHSMHEDVWVRANCRAVATFVAQLDQRIDASAARARGLFSGGRALELETGLGPLLVRDAGG